MWKRKSHGGTAKQRRQAHHGPEGAARGRESLLSQKYVTFQKELQKERIPESQRPGRPSTTPQNEQLSRRKRQQIKVKNRRTFTYFTISQQLMYCAIYDELKPNHKPKNRPGIEQNLYIIAAQTFCEKNAMSSRFAKKWFPSELAPRKRNDLRKRLLKILKRIIEDKFLLMHACAVGEGAQYNFHAATPPKFEFEPEIEERLLTLMRSGASINSFVVSHVAIQTALDNGMLYFESTPNEANSDQLSDVRLALCTWTIQRTHC